MQRQPDHLLLDALREQLALFDQGVSEYDLIKALQSPPWQLFEGINLSDTLEMFQCHFVVFNALYVLSDELRNIGWGELDIHTLSIQRKPVVASKEDITAHDGLKAYYLNWDNFSDTLAADVDAMLNDFWRRMAAGSWTIDEQSDARHALEFSEDESLSLPIIKKRYRQLLQQHHPDKGGTTARAQQISHAYRVLCQTINE